jgi:hypothetical protein
MDTPCEMFALCTSPADGLVKHPVLEWVPACKRCADKLESTLIPWSDIEIVG